MTQFQDIGDNEIRIIGQGTDHVQMPVAGDDDNNNSNGDKPDSNNRNNWKWFAIALAAIIVLVTAVLLFVNINNTPKDVKPDVTPDTTNILSSIVEQVRQDPSVPASLSVLEDTINDISIVVFTPQGCRAELQIGQIDFNDPSILLCAQAADVRGDNGDIVSAFILKGEPRSRGISKKGFCAIIGGDITLGMAEETPLYERVVESRGDFFRQYPLVHESQMQELKPKGKALRKALCILEGKVCIIKTLTKESFHDFAQALCDYGVSEAIALTGADATLFANTDEGKAYNTNVTPSIYENINYIIFRK